MYITQILLASWPFVFIGISAGTTYDGFNQGITNVTEYPIPLGTLYYRFHRNSIRDIPPGYFAAASTLTHIYLYDNKLTVVEKHMFSGLPWLRELNLWSNMIHKVQSECFKENQALTTLILHENRIQVFPESMFDPQNHPSLLQDFYIHYNPLQCDESISWLKRADGDWLNVRNPHLVVCDGPPVMQGCKWDDLTIQDLQTGKNMLAFISRFINY